MRRRDWRCGKALSKSSAFRQCAGEKFADWPPFGRKNCDCHVSVLMPDYAHSVNLVEFLVGLLSEGEAATL
jgi:hypothetical protein